MKKDKVLTRAIIISVVLHLVAVTFIGRTSGTRLNAAAIAPVQQRLMNVELVKDPLSDPPKPVVVPPANPDTPQTATNPVSPNPFGNHAPVPPGSRPVKATNHAGGAINTGTNSSGGDIPNLGNGRTSVGVVPGDHGSGNGSDTRPGTGPVEPPRPVEPVHVAPIPTPPLPSPPQPKRITVTLCDVSNMPAGEHCKSTHKQTFNEGEQPKRTCDKCKAPDNSRTAPQAKPVLTHDVHPRIPDSVDEGQSLEVEVEYYVDTDGGVSGVRVTKSSGNRDLDRAVTSAASQWRYKPAVADGSPLRVKVSRAVRCKT